MSWKSLGEGFRNLELIMIEVLDVDFKTQFVSSPFADGVLLSLEVITATETAIQLAQQHGGRSA